MYSIEKQTYSGLMRGSFKALGHFADEALTAPTTRDFFKIISENIVPLIAKSETFQSFFLEWLSEKGHHKKEQELAEKNAIKEITNAFIKLKINITKQIPLKNTDIDKAVVAIEDVLEFREVYAMPPYYEVAFDRLKELCYALLKLGHIDIVKEFGEVIYIDKSHYDHITQQMATTQEPEFRQFTFSLSMSKLCQLNKVFSWDDTSSNWVIWEYLGIAEWCWQTPLSYFEDKKLEYSDGHACKQSRFLLNLHANWAEMNAIKKGTHNHDNILFFKQSRYKNYLKTLLNNILLHQEIHGVPDSTATACSPHSIELRLHNHKPLLDVEWLEGSLIETYQIHKFNEDSAIKQFTNEIISSLPATLLSSEELASGLSVAKYLTRSKLEGTLAEVFFINRSTHKIALRSKRVYLSEVPQVDLVKLRQHIKSLININSYPFHSEN